MRKTNKIIITLLVIISAISLEGCVSDPDRKEKELNNNDIDNKCIVMKGIEDTCIVQSKHKRTHHRYTLFYRNFRTSKFGNMNIGKYDYENINEGDTIIPN